MSTGNLHRDESYLRVERFYNALRNLNDLEKSDIRNVVMAVLNPTSREKQVTLNYHRAAINLELLLALTDTKQFQAIAMLARAIFELAVELKLISLNVDAADKIELFTRIELLHAAERIVEFKRVHPEAQVHHETQEAFIKVHAQAIRDEQATVWPGSTNINHWTNKKIGKRVRELGEPFERIYEAHYPQLSWYSHSGITGLANATTKSIALLAGISYAIAVDSYMQILEVVVSEFKLSACNPTIKDKIEYAKAVAFTESQDEADRLRYAYGV